MRLTRLKIENIRNIEAITFTPSPGMNVFYGENASGKTSLLEAIYLLSCGKSFRTHHLSHILRRNESVWSVFGQININSQETALGIEQRDGKIRMRADGQTLKKASELANHVPLIVIHQESHRIITDSPRYRRKFMDWGVFHVEQHFLESWRRYFRALKQRNKLLQQRGSSTPDSLWDNELEQTAEKIHLFRKTYFDQFLQQFSLYAEKLLNQKVDVIGDYSPGWDVEKGYKKVLCEYYQKDKQRGYTQKGPHRADMILKLNGVPLHEQISRGQQKQLVYALHFAQAAVFRERLDKPCILLIDDLTAELDEGHIKSFVHLIEELKVQVFLTTTDEKKLKKNLFREVKKMFHVEHGNVKEVL